MTFPDVVHQDDPAWLARARAAAAERADAAGLPTTSEEEWRYSRIDDLDLSTFAPITGGTTAPASFGLASDAAIAGAAAVIDLVDGRVVATTVGDAAGLTITTDTASADSAMGSVMTEPTDTFADLNTMLVTDPVVVNIAPGAVVDGPIVIRHRVTTDGAVIAARVVVVAGADSEATVVETQSSDEVRALVLPVTELRAEQASRLRYLVVQEHAETVWQIGTQVSTIDKDAHLSTNAVAIGGDYARLRCDTRMIGSGAEGDIKAVYFGERAQALDFRTFQTHVAPNTHSNLVFKGALDGSSRSIYTGLIRIEPDASGVEAYQTNRNIKLSDQAWAESVPNLEIENNDVKCSHASAVGPIDDEQKFYLESRGVPTEVAERLVVQGFFADIVATLPHAGLAEAVEAELTSRLQAQTEEVPA